MKARPMRLGRITVLLVVATLGQLNFGSGSSTLDPEDFPNCVGVDRMTEVANLSDDQLRAACRCGVDILGGPGRDWECAEFTVVDYETCESSVASFCPDPLGEVLECLVARRLELENCSSERPIECSNVDPACI